MHPSVPTLGEYLPAVIAAAGPGANRTYGSYWARMVALWGARPLDQISASDIEALRHHTAATARSRRNSRRGRHAGEHVIAAPAPSTTELSPTDSSLRAPARPTASPSPAAPQHPPRADRS